VNTPPRAIRLSWPALAVAALIAGETWAQTVTAAFQDGVSPTSRYAGTKDVTLTEDVPTESDPNLNQDGDTLRADGFPARRASLIRIGPLDGGAASPAAVITSVVLQHNMIDSTDRPYPVWEILRPWDERQATFMQARDGGTWPSPAPRAWAPTEAPR
jgi:hypothetical protein